MAKPDLHDCIHARVRRAGRALGRFYDEALRPSGLKATQFTLLATLDRVGESTVAELADQIGMDRTTLTRNLTVMQREGWIERKPGMDRRTQILSASRAGRDRVAEAMPLWRSAHRTASARLDDKRGERLLRYLDRLITLAD
jgi:DNA-binding MarR family transcriptional regulator